MTFSEILSAVASGTMSEYDANVAIEAIHNAKRPVGRPKSKAIVPAKSAPEGFLDRQDWPSYLESTAVHRHMSQGFSHIQTSAVVEAIAKETGWMVYTGKGSLTGKVVKPNSRGELSGRSVSTARHAVTLRHPDQMKAGFTRGNRFIQANLMNGADGTTRLMFGLGPFEIVCENGMVSQRGGFSVSMKHQGITLDDVITCFLTLVSNADIMLEQLDVLDRIMLTEDQALTLASQCLQYRWAVEIENDRHQTVPNPALPNPRALLSSLYHAQRDLTAANVMNNIQRNLLGQITIPSDGSKSGMRQSPAVTNLDKVVRINRGVDFETFSFISKEFTGVELPTPQTVYEPRYRMISEEPATN